MFQKGSKVYSIFKNKCPQCNEGDFFKHKFSYNLLKTTETLSNCPHCNLKYMREPSFFYGAMYVGYAISVALATAIYVLTIVFFHTTILQNILFISVGLFVLAPWSLRLARTIWMHIFIKYQKEEKDYIH